MRIFVEIFLMIIFRIVPFPGLQDLGDDLLALVMLILDFGRDLSRNGFLFWRVIKDGGAVLGASIGSLRIEGGRVMHPIKELDQFCIVDLFIGRVLDLKGFSVVLRTTGRVADLWEVRRLGVRRLPFLASCPSLSLFDALGQREVGEYYLLVGWLGIGASGVTDRGLDGFVLVMFLEGLLYTPVFFEGIGKKKHVLFFFNK